jgi:transglutaminase-like putative cysteine protease
MRPFLAITVRPDTRELLRSMAATIKADFAYEARETEGTQTPDETLKRGVGSCRDFAFLMMEAVRRLGMAARFVSGYLYDPALDGGGEQDLVGSGATHAWLQVYLPGAGWAPFDPTNAVFGGQSLIRVAFAREPRLAAPVIGSWIGREDDFEAMDVEIDVARHIERR